MTKERLVVEYLAMRECWGDKPKLCKDKHGRLWWEYVIHLEKNKFPIKIIYPESYPSTPPNIKCTVLGRDVPHMYNDDKYICWMKNSSRKSNNQWEPSRDTAALCIGVAYRWFMAYLVWQATEEWPVDHA